MVKQKKRTCITQSGKNYAINCAIQGVRLIWKQKIWSAICKFLLITDQSECLVWFFFLHWINSFLHCFRKKTALLLTNQNGEIFSCILLGGKQEAGQIVSISNHRLPRRGNICRLSCFVRLSLIRASRETQRKDKTRRGDKTHQSEHT